MRDVAMPWNLIPAEATTWFNVGVLRLEATRTTRVQREALLQTTGWYVGTGLQRGMWSTVKLTAIGTNVDGYWQTNGHQKAASRP
ncbi:MAG TPA: hypothetical protein VGP82_25595 [Ktedonobacterales bacterium]|jgi:hypothetical protein|nr:hypothetical protein [Ktedonobacterales bacterium]